MERDILTKKIELEALKLETDQGSIARRKKIEEEVDSLEAKLKQLNDTWQDEKSVLNEAKEAKVKLEAALRELENAQRTGQYARAGELMHSVIPELQAKADETKETDTSEDSTLLADSVSSKHVSEVVSRTTGIPLESLLSGEKQKLLKMEEFMKKRIVGQDEAIEACADLVRLSKAGLLAHDRPMGVFLFLGPTGVGKTETAKALCEFLFDDETAMTRIDMSEYMEKHSVSKLIGSPPGYIGYEEGGRLTEAVRRRPYQVVLFDEFEKAHRDVGNLLLQMFDEGHLTDSQGRKVDFRNTIIIMTSNLGSDIMSEASANANVTDHVMDVVKGYFSPELLNRIDEIQIFNRLRREDMNKIVDIQLRRVQDLLENDKQILLKVSDAARDWLASISYEPSYGARPLRRNIQYEVLRPISKKILAGEITDNTVLQVDKSETEDELTFVASPRPDNADDTPVQESIAA